LIVKIAGDVLIRKLLAEEKLGESVFIARKKAPNRMAEQKGVILLLVGMVYVHVVFLYFFGD
jgi:hypothetical protein